MGLPSINPPIRVLIRTRLAQLQKIDPSFDKADTELIKRLCDRLSITDETKIRHLITRISDDKKLDDKKMDDKKLDDKKLDDEKLDDKKLDDKKLERVDIIFDYGSPTIDCQPQVMIYSITVEGSDLIIKQRFNPNIRKFVNLTVETFESINLENNRCFPIRADIRAETRRQRRAVLPT
ncbi:hypothetical protein B0J14DRAFT_602392 [Halenospora varia]|nr:hypothetical protein B0J14DRAFT_602392 [Halenospora varia]